MQPESIGFGAAISALVSPDGAGMHSMHLAPSAPRECPELDALRTASAGDLFDGAEVQSLDDARCVRSGLFLYFGALDESHRVSQAIRSSSGSYWHGIMHRQERDWGNAKYWFRRTGPHPVFRELERETGTGWDPFAFVDRCRAACKGVRGAEDVTGLQMLEWRLLMLHCCRRALGR